MRINHLYEPWSFIVIMQMPARKQHTLMEAGRQVLLVGVAATV